MKATLWATAAVIAFVALLAAVLLAISPDGLTSAEIAIGFLSALISALGVLFAVGAIAAGYLLYRQSREFREERTRFFAEQAEIFNKQRDVEIAALRETRETLLTGLDTATVETRERLEQLAETYARRIAAAEESRFPTPYPPMPGFGEALRQAINLDLPVQVCIRCERAFQAVGQGLLVARDGPVVKCPYCAKVQPRSTEPVQPES